MWCLNMGPSRLSKTIQGITVTGLATVGAFFVWTKHCHMTPLNQFTPTTEPLFQSSWYKKFNPLQNPTTHDECVRRLPLFKIRPELVEDAQKGGSKLVEAFSQGIWGGPGTFVLLLLSRHQLPSLSTYCPGVPISLGLFSKKPASPDMVLLFISDYHFSSQCGRRVKQYV